MGDEDDASDEDEDEDEEQDEDEDEEGAGFGGKRMRWEEEKQDARMHMFDWDRFFQHVRFSIVVSGSASHDGCRTCEGRGVTGSFTNMIVACLWLNRLSECQSHPNLVQHVFKSCA